MVWNLDAILFLGHLNIGQHNDRFSTSSGFQRVGIQIPTVLTFQISKQKQNFPQLNVKVNISKVAQKVVPRILREISKENCPECNTLNCCNSYIRNFPQQIFLLFDQLNL